MYQCVDRFFYGSSERRDKQLQQRLKGMSENYNAQLFVNAL